MHACMHARVRAGMAAAETLQLRSTPCHAPRRVLRPRPCCSDPQPNKLQPSCSTLQFTTNPQWMQQFIAEGCLREGARGALLISLPGLHALCKRLLPASQWAVHRLDIKMAMDHPAVQYSMASSQLEMSNDAFATTTAVSAETLDEGLKEMELAAAAAAPAAPPSAPSTADPTTISLPSLPLPLISHPPATGDDSPEATLQQHAASRADAGQGGKGGWGWVGCLWLGAACMHCG
jgi:hypothetical protein